MALTITILQIRQKFVQLQFVQLQSLPRHKKRMPSTNANLRVISLRDIYQLSRDRIYILANGWLQIWWAFGSGAGCRQQNI